jgi:hypothetical protein
MGTLQGFGIPWRVGISCFQPSKGLGALGGFTIKPKKAYTSNGIGLLNSSAKTKASLFPQKRRR